MKVRWIACDLWIPAFYFQLSAFPLVLRQGRCGLKSKTINFDPPFAPSSEPHSAASFRWRVPKTGIKPAANSLGRLCVPRRRVSQGSSPHGKFSP